jgi:sulfite exporter TauE/SafE
LRPQLAFNAGRVIGYGVFGAAVGALGSVITLSPLATGILTIGVSCVMIILGFELLDLFPRTSRLMPRMPKVLAHRIYNLSDSDRRVAPFALGALTFFLPCGFTQALQLYVLATGSVTVGVFTMFVFALGTLPALLSLSALTSFAKGAFQHYLLRFAGAMVILLGVMNIQSGIVLAGGKPIDFAGYFGMNAKDSIAHEELVPLTDGKQIVRMRAAGFAYTPNRFSVRAGVPVEWHIDGAAAAGCGRVITMPALGIIQMLKVSGETVIQFTPTEPGELAFNCSMGMMTPNSAFIVVPNNI